LKQESSGGTSISMDNRKEKMIDQSQFRLGPVKNKKKKEKKKDSFQFQAGVLQ